MAGSSFCLGVWILGQLGLVALAVLDPVLVSGLARLSLLSIGVLGSLLIGYLAVRGQDRALALVPTWLLFVVWLFGAGVATLGQLSGDIVAPALTSGLVLILVLLGFTVTQFAFRSFEPLGRGAAQPIATALARHLKGPALPFGNGILAEMKFQLALKLKMHLGFMKVSLPAGWSNGCSICTPLIVSVSVC